MSGQQEDAVATLVGRFQVPKLHRGHRFLFDHVGALHKEMFVVLGVRKAVRSRRYPLTFEERRVMIEQAYPNTDLVFRPLEDHPFDHRLWSRNLDELIEKTFPRREILLYGSRDNFFKFYTGKFRTIEVPTLIEASGTAVRETVFFPNTADARAAIIYEMQNRPPFMYSAADLAIVDTNKEQVLLIGKNSHDGKLSFPGGHVEKSDTNSQMTAIREAHEEVPGVRFSEPQHLGTMPIDDPRYRGTPDGVVSSFFMSRYLGGTPTHGDDADKVEWVTREAFLGALVPWHQPLGHLLLASWPKKS